MKNIAVLGATGSIGSHTLDVIRRHPDRFKAIALASNRDVSGMFSLCVEFEPACVAMADSSAALALKEKIHATGMNCLVLSGVEGICELARMSEVDSVMSAIVGSAGLMPTLTAIDFGKQVWLANKESLVMAGELMIRRLTQSGAQLLPIDSEHNAIFQCLQSQYQCGKRPEDVKKLWLTASGGPFYADTVRDLALVTPEQAVAHPKWKMGKKISVDSATLMNKGLEVIEAHWLFAIHPAQIDVVVHPQSIVHSLVEFVDGSVMAQLGQPDMRVPISHAMAWPGRIESGVTGLDLFEIGSLEFVRPRREAFPCLDLAWQVLEMGGTAPAVLNAANEVAVSAFLEGRCGFTDIPEVIRRTLDDPVALESADQLETILDADCRARNRAEEILATLG